MANTGAVTLDGGAIGPALGMGAGRVLIIPGSFNAGATYATGGNPITPPDAPPGYELVDIMLTTIHDGTRIWSVVDVQSAPKVKAYDAFATEEGNGTNTSAITLRALFVYQG